ncbi:MAG: hypothetical protein HY719_03800 [Planctomycetes bacterium]|nr:hypothetical protein [Planctomycetota bacterium]
MTSSGPRQGGRRRGWDFVSRRVAGAAGAGAVRGRLLLCLALASGCDGTGRRGDLDRADALLEARRSTEEVREALEEYEAALAAAGAERRALLGAARAAVQLAAEAPNPQTAGRYAELGRAYADRLRRADPNSAPGHYFYALSLGYAAQADKTKGLPLAGEMKAAVERVAAIDPAYDSAGAWRFLGILYREVPPGESFGGDVDKAIYYLGEAAKLAPDYPENHLALAETLLRAARDDPVPNSRRQRSAAALASARRAVDTVAAAADRYPMETPRWRAQAQTLLAQAEQEAK